ncbi:MAG TPA: hypothetical protein VJ695_02900 [Nitrososphaera sp.]|nr:hypothetical protein [Nitrososphaera sp.]
MFNSKKELKHYKDKNHRIRNAKLASATLSNGTSNQAPAAADSDKGHNQEEID